MVKRKVKRGRPKIKYDSYIAKFSVDAYLKIKKFCEIAGHDEWLGFLLKDFNNGVKGNVIHITDIYFPPQMVSGGNCTLKSEEFAKEIEQMIKTEEGQETLQRFCGWMHSHNTMGAFFSSTDVETNARMHNYMPTTKVFLTMVVNNNMKFKAKALVKLKRKSEEIDDVTVQVDFKNVKKIKKQCQELWNKQVELDKITQYQNKTDTIRIPKKYLRSLTNKLVKQIVDAEYKVIYAKNLKWSIQKFTSRRKLTKRQRKTIGYLFRAMYMNRISEDEAFENFAKDYKPKKEKFVHRDSQHKPISQTDSVANVYKAQKQFNIGTISKNIGRKLKNIWVGKDNKVEYEFETFEDYKKKKQWEEDNHGYY